MLSLFDGRVSENVIEEIGSIKSASIILENARKREWDNELQFRTLVWLNY